MYNWPFFGQSKLAGTGFWAQERKKWEVSSLCSGDFSREQISPVTSSRGFMTEHFAIISWRDLLNTHREKLVGLFNRNLFSAEIRCCSWSKEYLKRIRFQTGTGSRERQIWKMFTDFFLSLNFREKAFFSQLVIESHLQKYTRCQCYLWFSLKHLHSPLPSSTFSMKNPHSVLWLRANTIELSSCWEFKWMFRNIILEESDEFCFLSSNEYFGADLPLCSADINWSGIYYAFSKYYFRSSHRASLWAITGFRHLKPIPSFENTLLLSTPSGNKRE